MRCQRDGINRRIIFSPETSLIRSSLLLSKHPKMYFFKVSVLVMAVVGYTMATGGGSYGGGAGAGSYGAGSGAGGYGAGAGAGGVGGGAGSYGAGAGASGFGGASRGFGGASSYGGGASSYGGGAGGYGQNEAPKPYNFDYQSADEQGNVHYRNEEGDASGTVRGTYGYTDTQGLFRVVEYIADASGFRANIRTNEPGTDGKESPADVQITAEQPPAGIQDKFTGGRSGGAGAYRGGAGAGSYGAGAGAGSYGAGAGAGSYGAGAGAGSYGAGAGAGAGSGFGGAAGSGFAGGASGGFGGARGGASSYGGGAGAGVRSGKSGY